MVLIILALIWAAALLPPFLRSRMEGSPADSVGRFRRRLRVLESAAPGAAAVARDPLAPRAHRMPASWATEARRLRRLRRRQRVAMSMLAVMGATLVVGLVPSMRLVLAAHVAADLAFFLYVALLLRARNDEVESQFARLRVNITETPPVDEVPPPLVGGQAR